MKKSKLKAEEKPLLVRSSTLEDILVINVLIVLVLNFIIVAYK